jgi:hypothetical protein
MDDLAWLAILLGLAVIGFAYILLLAIGDEGAGS